MKLVSESNTTPSPVKGVLFKTNKFSIGLLSKPFYFLVATILIVGGWPEPIVNNSVQALDQDGNFLCDLPDIPHPYGRFSATMDGNILCGGTTNGGPASLLKNCIFYEAGSWVDPADILVDQRLYSVSWGRPNPPLNVDRSHIFGGLYNSTNTTEIAFEIGSNPSYNYNG